MDEEQEIDMKPIVETKIEISDNLLKSELVDESGILEDKDTEIQYLLYAADNENHTEEENEDPLDHSYSMVENQQGENGRFDAWMRVVEVTVDGRGKMGSLVGASEEVRSGGIGMENLLMEYAVATLFLINMVVDAPERDLQLRVHIRAQFTACGIKRILTKMEGFQYDVIDKQIERFRTNEAIDYEDLLERENSSIKDLY